MENLSNLKCKPCSGNSSKMNFEEIKLKIAEIEGWGLNNNNEMIFKKFKFKNFKTTIDFVNKVGDLAEKEGHHPDISFGWGYCLIMIHTHAIKGLSINDFILASKINLLN